MNTKSKYEEWSGKKFIRVSRKRYLNFIRFFKEKIEGNFFMDWVDSYDWSLRSGKYERGTFESSAECKVARHFVGCSKDTEEFYISVDYIEKHNYDLNTVVPKEKEQKLTKKEKMILDAFCKAFDKAFKAQATKEAIEYVDDKKTS